MICIVSMQIMGCINDDSACDPYFNEEPQVTVQFRNSLSFTEVYGIKPGFRQYIELKDSTYRLPINLNTEATTYVFRSKTAQDTLELLYTIDTKYLSEDCGFVLELKDLQNGNLTTFDSVYVSSYEYHVEIE
ncbi:DUF6452 family protein [Fulvivirga sediminis]|uniref:Uncharacterized protein n=1 Tax=Fulvivirga sediminis TaxID=2803949 RepID=A0A937F4M3_9BACT|nr:DUF6452 family protein [Fulvivirga sediminis]MBL3654802.1 hypothetical protein [Fulvivirga sediminis]